MRPQMKKKGNGALPKIVILKADKATVDEKWSVLIYGNSGVGKTRLGATAKNPLFLLTERNGAQTIRATNPNASYIVIDNLQTLRAAIKMARDGAFSEYDCLVLDSLTEAQRLVLDDIFDPNVKDQMPIGDWQILFNRTRAMIRTLRNANMNLVCICLCDRSENESTGVTTYRPSFNGKRMAYECAQYFNAVGYAFKTTRKETVDNETKTVVEYGVCFDGSTNFLTKSCAQLTGIVDPDLIAWGEAFTYHEPEPLKRTPSRSKNKTRNRPNRPNKINKEK